MATVSRVPKVPADRTGENGSFYAGMGVFCLAFSIAAFGPSIANPSHRLGPVTPLLTLHGVAFTAWLVLFIGQAVLARTRKLVLHRRLGVSSILLAATLVVLGFQVTIAMGRRGYDMAGDIAGARYDSLAAMAFPLLDIFLFASLFLAAFLYRHRSAIHKRLMLLVLTGAMMPAPITHFIGHYVLLRDKGFLTPLIIAAFLAAGPIHDRLTLQRIHPVFLWLPPAIFVLEVTWAALVVPSALWHALAVWLVN
jgi:hypothetical protein